MPTNGSLGVKTHGGIVCPASPAQLGFRRAFGKKVVKGQGIGFLFSGVLVILAACLAVGLVASIVLEAFDSDPDLWPYGSENFNVALEKPFEVGLQSTRVPSGLAAILCLVATAGVYLILSHRARSALATDPSSTCVVFHRAEPWGRHSD